MASLIGYIYVILYICASFFDKNFHPSDPQIYGVAIILAALIINEGLRK